MCLINLLASLNDFLYSYILIFLLVAAGIYFSIRTKFVQFRLIGDAIKALKEKAEKNDMENQYLPFRL